MIATSRFSACTSLSLPVGSFACLACQLSAAVFPGPFGYSSSRGASQPSHDSPRARGKTSIPPPRNLLASPCFKPQPQGPGLCCAVRGGQYALAAVAGPDLRAAMSFTSKVLRAEAASVCSVETDGTFRPPSASSAKPVPRGCPKVPMGLLRQKIQEGYLPVVGEPPKKRLGRRPTLIMAERVSSRQTPALRQREHAAA
jgi:hypothetical protein